MIGLWVFWHPLEQVIKCPIICCCLCMLGSSRFICMYIFLWSSCGALELKNSVSCRESQCLSRSLNLCRRGYHQGSKLFGSFIHGVALYSLAGPLEGSLS